MSVSETIRDDVLTCITLFTGISFLFFPCLISASALLLAPGGVTDGKKMRAAARGIFRNSEVSETLRHHFVIVLCRV